MTLDYHFIILHYHNMIITALPSGHGMSMRTWIFQIGCFSLLPTLSIPDVADIRQPRSWRLERLALELVRDAFLRGRER